MIKLSPTPFWAAIRDIISEHVQEPLDKHYNHHLVEQLIDNTTNSILMEVEKHAKEKN